MSKSEVTRIVHEVVLDEMYVAMLDAYERLENGTSALKRCLNYLEQEHGYQPPTGILERRQNDW